MFQPRHAFRRLITAPLFLVAIFGCMGSGGGRGGRPGSPDERRSTPRRASLPGVMDPVALYENAGLMAAQEPLPFVGNVRYLAGSSSDTTLVLVTLSLANRALTFTPEGEGHRAGYSVVIDARQGATTSAHSDARESVRVASFKETIRADESVIFQEFLRLPSGQHVLTVAIRDEGSSRTSTADLPLSVPRFGQTALSSPVAVYQAQPRSSTDSVPVLVANPRATAVFGRDSTIQLYLEGYNLAADAPVDVVVTNEKRTPVWRDTITLSRHGLVSGDIVTIPVGKLGVGQLAMTASLIGSTDTVRSPVFVNFADDIAIASFDQMLDLLRYFTTEDRLRALRDTSAEQRAAAWGAFWRETDPAPTTAEHEGLREYFNRIQLANDRFREEGIPGWLTDRGMVYVTLGEPDQVLEQGESNLSQRGRAQMWTYNQHQLQVVFIDQTGFGRWRMTTASEGDFQSVAHRVRARD
ncbi:MAG: GWxTD domain-containing protein [Gemmatimonadaceae bacterium]